MYKRQDENGTTYFVCGSTGEKYYEAVNDGNFEVFSDEQKPCYLTVSATSGSFTVTALRPDGTVLDTYTKTKTVLEASVGTESARVNEAFEVSVTTSGDVQNVKLFNTCLLYTSNPSTILTFPRMSGFPLMPSQ